METDRLDVAILQKAVATKLALDMKNLPTFILKKLRLSNPWNYKAPFLIAVPYLLIGLGKMEWEIGLTGIGCSFLTIFGIAGFGYLSNDYTDREQDLAAGKPNALLGLKGWQIGLLLLFFLALAILPWVFFFPVTWVTGGLLAAEFLLFVLYAVPPFRFKERGFAGALTDALYAHALPAVLAAWTFYLLGDQTYNKPPWLLGTLGGWQLVLGLRNILLHQLKDHENDLASGTRTWVTGWGRQRSWQLIKWLFLPLELLLFFGFMGLVSLTIPGFILAWPLFLLYTILRIKLLITQPVPRDLRNIVYNFLDDFYVEWIPLLILGFLALQSPWYLILAGIHFLLFKNGVKRFFRESWRRVTGKT